MSVIQSNWLMLDVLELKRTRFNSQNWIAYLFTNDHMPTAADVIADYTVATFDGAAGLPVAWSSAPALAPAGGAIMYGDVIEWQPTMAGAGELCYGVVVLGALPVRYLAAWRFGSGPYLVGADLSPLLVLPVWVERSVPPL